MEIQRSRNSYDWVKLKAGYMSSAAVSVQEFFRLELGGEKAGKLFISKNFQEQTSGWRKEKEKMKQEIVEAVKEEFKQSEVERMGQALDGIRFALVRMCDEYKKMALNGKALSISPRILRCCWEMVRTENGLPIKILKEEPPAQPEIDEDELMEQLYQDAHEESSD